MSILNTLQARPSKKGPEKEPQKAIGGYFNSYEEGKAALETMAETLVAKYGQAIVKLVGPNDEAGDHIGFGIRTRTESTNAQMWRTGRVYITDLNVFVRAGLDVTTLPGIVWETTEAPVAAA